MRQVAKVSCLLWTIALSTQAVAQEATNNKPATEPDSAEAAGEATAAATATTNPSGAAGNAQAAAPAAPVPPPAEAQAEPKPEVGDVSLHGYFRGGYGLSSEKGRMVCFQAAGAPSKYRLGNECDQYGEFHFAAPIYVAKDGMVAIAHFMPAVYIPSTDLGHPDSIKSDVGLGWNGASWGFPYMYMEMKNIPGLAGGTPWVGRRYYKREDYHSTDFFYWNPSGLGAGVEDINLGKEMRLSYAAFAVDAPGFRDPALPAYFPTMAPRKAVGVRNDIQLRGIRLYPSGELQLGVNIVANWSDNDVPAGTDPTTVPPKTYPGWSGTVQHVQDLPNGKNKLALQYGQGAGIGFGFPDALTTSADSTRFRVVDVLTIDPTDWFGAQAGLVFQHDKVGSASQDWFSAGARGSFAFTDHIKLLLDVGHDTVSPSVGGASSLTKFTIAPALSAGRGVMTRPELRLFCTVATWNTTASRVGVDSAGLYKGTDKRVGATFGAHSEVWW